MRFLYDLLTMPVPLPAWVWLCWFVLGVAAALWQARQIEAARDLVRTFTRRVVVGSHPPRSPMQAADILWSGAEIEDRRLLALVLEDGRLVMDEDGSLYLVVVIKHASQREDDTADLGPADAPYLIADELNNLNGYGDSGVVRGEQPLRLALRYKLDGRMGVRDAAVHHPA